MTEVVAIMLNWNGGSLAVQSALSILAQDCTPTLWVVDNASTDGSLEAIVDAARGKSLRIIKNTINAGFAKGNNQALTETVAADFVLLVNNDVVLPDEASLSIAIGRMTTDRRMEGVCGRYEYPDGGFQRFYNRLPRPVDLIFHYGIFKNLYWLISSAQMGYYYASDLDFSQEQYVDQPAFSCVMLCRQAIDRVGLFDEEFPIFFNDVDYCWRWAQAGLKWRYLPSWRIVHFKSQGTEKLAGLLQPELVGAVNRFARKHYRPIVALLVCAAVTAQCFFRKYFRGDFDGSIWGVWTGRLPFSRL